MILSTTVTVCTQPIVMDHYRGLGYTWSRFREPIEVSVAHLPNGSGTNVHVACDRCPTEFYRAFHKLQHRQMHLCRPCTRSEHARYRIQNPTSKMREYHKVLNKRTGSLHHNWNPNKPEFLRYSTKVRALSDKVYKENICTINPNNHKRTLAGVPGGYQLDHITPIKTGFDTGIPEEVLAQLNNLQMVPWKVNNAKRSTSPSGSPSGE